MNILQVFGIYWIIWAIGWQFEKRKISRIIGRPIEDISMGESMALFHCGLEGLKDYVEYKRQHEIQT
jgi:hypothetical protein